MIKWTRFLVFCCGWVLWSSCEKLESTIDLNLENEASSLVVECYLEVGQPYRLLLTETKNYLDSLNSCAFVKNAIVVITHKGQKDTLKEAAYFGEGCGDLVPFWNADFTRIFNYGSNTICPKDLNNDFSLEVWDTLNDRHVTARTRFLPPVTITDFNYNLNAAKIASCFLGCKDNPNEENYYRLTLHKSSLTRRTTTGLFPYVAENPYFDEIRNDRNISAQGDIMQTSDYEFYRTDTVIGSIYHIDKAYYDYIETSRSAEEANLSPFVQPAAIISNIEGGNGIFTFLAYQRDTMFIPW